jgi:hypothetical protein
VALTPEEEAQYNALLAPPTLVRTNKPSETKGNAITLALRNPKGITAQKIAEMLAAMKKANEQAPPQVGFSAPVTSTPAPISGNFTAEDEKRYQQLLNESEVATPFADLAANAKKYLYDKPAELAAKAREGAVTALGNPSEEELIAQATATGKPNLLGITGRVVGETVAESIPLTPAEFAAQYLGGKAISAAAPLAARGVSNLALRTAASGLEAGLPGAEQSLFRAGIKPGGRALSAQATKGLARQLPKVQSEIAALTKGLRAEQKPVQALIPSFLKPKASSVPEIQAAEPAPGGPKDVYSIQRSAESSGAHARSVDANIKQFVNEQIRVPKGTRTPQRSNLNAIQEAQEKFELESGRKATSFLGGISKSLSRAWDPYGTTGWSVIESAGPAGQELSSIGRFVSFNAEQRAGRASRIIDDVFDGLLPNEAENVREVLDHGVQPATNKARSAAVAIRSILDDIAKEAKQHLFLKREGQVIPWEYMKNYFPHKMDVEAMEQVLKAKDSTRYKEVIKAVMDKEKMNLAKAEKLLENQLLRTKAATFGRLERSREFDSPLYLKDARNVLKDYVKNAFYRLETAKGFGRQNEKGLELLSKIQGDEARTAATSFVNDLVGTDPELAKQKFLKRSVGPIKSIVSRMVMGTSALMNSTQGIVGSGIEAGPLNMAKGLRDTLLHFKDAKNLAIRSGALTEDVLEEASKMVQRAYAKNTGFLGTESFNRILANATGKHRSAEFMELMRDGKDLDKVSRYLDKYKINMSEVMRRGHFNDYEIDRIGKGISDFSQGRSRPIDLPALADEGYGALLFHLRTFPLQYTKFLKDSVMNEAMDKNFNPLVTAAWLAPVVGEPVAVVAEALGRKRPEGWLARRIDAAGLVGGIGIARMVIDSVAQGSTNLFVPVAVSVGTRISSELGQAMEDAFTGEGTTSPVGRVTKVGLKNVVPPLAGRLPAPLAVPIIYASKARANESETLANIGQAIQRRLKKK